MSQHAHIPEEILAKIWKEQHLSDEIFTETGERIYVLSAGDENKEKGGPDFINAKIKVGNFTYVGDIEIDNTHSDWWKHGHNLNKRFNKVILHAIVNNESNQKFVFTPGGRKIHTFCFAPHVKPDVLESLRQSIIVDDDNKTNKVHCYKVSELADEKIVVDYLSELGILRFMKKCEKLVARLKELIYVDSLGVSEPVVHHAFSEEVYSAKLCYSDLQKKHVWEQLFYEGIFEALGYSQNKNIMHDLAQSVNINYIESLGLKKEEFVEQLEGFYFSISGLVPDESKIKNSDVLDYVRKISENSIKHFSQYDGKRFDSTDWHFFKQRPQNFPTIRIAAGSKIVYKLLYEDLIEKIVKKFYEIHDFKLLQNLVRNLLIIKGEGFWKKHYSFEKQTNESINYFLGISRADEIFVNVVTPFMYVYFEMFDKPKFANKTLALYTDIACDSDNALVTEMADALHLAKTWKKSVIYQGLIELFRSFCSKERCEECQIGKVVFTEDKQSS